MQKKSFNREIVGKNIKEKRLKGHLTQAQLAERTDISVVHLSHIENGTVNMSLKTLHALCDIFYCTPNDILLGAGYDDENCDGSFMKDGLASKDHEFIEHVSELLRQRFREERINTNEDPSES